MFAVHGRVGEYDLVKMLARSHGTAGMVCLALHARSRRRVAVKMIPRRPGEDAEALIAAEREGAMLQERLARRSDAVPRVYDCGDQDGVFYIAMEYIDGDDLDKQIGSGVTLPPERAARIVADVCGCLAEAHAPHHLVHGVRRSIIHGDVKPANIRVTPSGRAKLLDFGTAKPVAAEQRCAFSTYLTVEYASPERLDFGTIDADSDLWGAAVVLYEAIVGRRPWEDVGKRSGVAERPPRASEGPPAFPGRCPVALMRIATRALATELSDRYESAEAMKADLDKFLFEQNGDVHHFSSGPLLSFDS